MWALPAFLIHPNRLLPCLMRFFNSLLNGAFLILGYMGKKEVGLQKFPAVLKAQQENQSRKWAGNFLNDAILTLPPRYLADIPLDHRIALLRELSFLASDTRL
jgi:hypothetical protein